MFLLWLENCFNPIVLFLLVFGPKRKQALDRFHKIHGFLQLGLVLQISQQYLIIAHMSNEFQPYPILVCHDFCDVGGEFPSLTKSSKGGDLYFGSPAGFFEEAMQKLEFFARQWLGEMALEEDYFFNIPDDLNFSKIFMEARDGYKLLPHSDSRNRLISGMLYLDVAGIKSGGELVFYEHPNESGLPHLMETDAPVRETVVPRDGTLVLWLNSYNSYHSVPVMKGIRRSAYVSLDSCQKIWH